METVFLYITATDRTQAQMLATALLEARLIACANIFDGVSSLYWWEGKIEQTQEAVLICKAPAAHQAAIIAEVKRLHSYDIPCVVALPVSSGNPDFLQWIADQINA